MVGQDPAVAREATGRGDRRDRRDRRDRDAGGGSSAARVVPELSVLEKALARADLAAQVQPLDSVVKALRQARARSLQDLDMDTRGRLITTLSRVARQTRPADAPDAAPVRIRPGRIRPLGLRRGVKHVVRFGAGLVGGIGVGRRSLGRPPLDRRGVKHVVRFGAGLVGGIGVGRRSLGRPLSTDEVSNTSSAMEEANAASGLTATESGAEAPTPAPDAVSNTSSAATPAQTYGEVLFRVGLAWSAVGEAERAEAAFGAAGRQPSATELRSEPPREEPRAAPARGERGAPRGERPPRGPRVERAPRPERRVAPVRGATLEIPPELAGDWKAQAGFLESRGRTRDAARLHDRNGSFAEAARLFEGGGDLRSALRSALAAKDTTTARRLAEQLPPPEAQTLLEKSEAWELLMELHVRSGRFEEVAKLYERARQFDQAGLAWERAGKLSAARKAYERARDAGSVDCVRTLEVDRLVERGDRLGAALLLVQARRREEAVKLLEPLPPPKAFRFLQQLELHVEARALGERELQKATEDNKSMARARWLELLERPADAADAWEAAGRKDKAFPLLEKAGQFGKGARLAEAFGSRNEAIRLFRRAGEDAEADRLEALPPLPPPEPTSAAPDEADEDLSEGSVDSSHP